MSHGLPVLTHVISDYEKAFNDIDVDGDGCLTIEELKKLFEAQGQDYTEDELRQMVAGVDKNCNFYLYLYKLHFLKKSMTYK